jgi:autophagy-related protein 2
LWTPDVKANQLADVIAGIAPIRSVVNVGTGVADLVLLPIAAFQKDRRVFKGAKRGANSFMKSTALETIKLGARLATGTQVILERAESVLGGQFENSITTETMSDPALGGPLSRFAEQPEDVREGLKHAYKSMSRNLNLAGQTILALPMEVHERSGTEVRYFFTRLYVDS